MVVDLITVVVAVTVDDIGGVLVDEVPVLLAAVVVPVVDDAFVILGTVVLLVAADTFVAVT